MFRTVQILLLFILAYSVGSSQYIKFNAFDSIDGFELEIDSIEFKNLNNDIEKTFYSDSIVIPKVSSVATKSYKNEVRIYPNPAEDELNVKFSSNSTYQSDVKIFDLNGRELHNSDINITRGINQFNFNISGLNRGMYLIKIADKVEKFIKSSDGQSKEINSTDIGSRSLIKENEIQSKFDYKFRVYSKNYTPIYYYLENLEYDTVVNVKLTPEPSPFKNKYVKVELYLQGATFENHFYSTQQGGIDERDTITKNIFITYSDTLVFRGGGYYQSYFKKIDINRCRLYAEFPNDTSKSCYETRSIQFEVDTNNKSIKNFVILFERETYFPGEINERYLYNYIFEKINIRDDLFYNSVDELLVIKKLTDINLEYIKNNKQRTGLFTHNYIKENFISLIDKENSYIKIEFTDTK